MPMTVAGLPGRAICLGATSDRAVSVERMPARSRAVLVPMSLLGAAALVVAGCSAAPEPKPAPAPGSSSPSTTAGTSVTVAGAPAALRRVVEKVYAKSDRPVTAKAHLGRWKGEKIAVVVAGDDVTLLTGPRWTVVGGWWPSLGKARPELGGAIHVLLIGSDARPGQDHDHARGDALQLVGLDGTGGGGVVGIPRDSWVTLPNGSKGKINAALTSGGPAGQTAAVESLSGIRTTGYLCTGFGGFKRIVEQLGGIDYTAPKAVSGEASGAKVRAGRQRLGPEQALAYARERKTLPDGDFGRSRNQGLLLVGAFLDARRRGPSELARALTVVQSQSSSDLTAAEALRFGAWIYKISPMRVGHEVVTGSTPTIGGQSVVVLGDDARATFRDFEDARLGG